MARVIDSKGEVRIIFKATTCKKLWQKVYGVGVVEKGVNRENTIHQAPGKAEDA